MIMTGWDVEPMLAHDDATLLGMPGWLLQRKYDGTRVLIVKDGNIVKMIGRSFKNDYSDRYPEIVEEIRNIPEKTFILDGELTFFRGGVDVFQTALSTFKSKRKFDVAKIMLFDAIMVGGHDMRPRPIEYRINVLHDIVHMDGGYKFLQVVDTFTDHTEFRAIFQAIVYAHGGEGVVLKRAGSTYVGGSRNLMVKVKREVDTDCVVCGITHGEGAREATFGALILAQYNAAGKLVHVGSTSGFDNRTMMVLHDTIAGMPSVPNPCGFPDERRVKKFVAPELVIRVKYMERTERGALRHPAFIDVRTDKKPRECVMGV